MQQIQTPQPGFIRRNLEVIVLLCLAALVVYLVAPDFYRSTWNSFKSTASLQYQAISSGSGTGLINSAQPAAIQQPQPLLGSGGNATASGNTVNVYNLAQPQPTATPKSLSFDLAPLKGPQDLLACTKPAGKAISCTKGVFESTNDATAVTLVNPGIYDLVGTNYKITVDGVPTRKLKANASEQGIVFEKRTKIYVEFIPNRDGKFQLWTQN